MNRSEALQSPTVHNLTKTILSLSEKLDPVDVVGDIQLALDIVTAELNDMLGTFEKDMTIKPAGSGEPSLQELIEHRDEFFPELTPTEHHDGHNQTVDK